MDEKRIEEELKKVWDEKPNLHSDKVKEASWNEFQSMAFPPKKKNFKFWRYAAAAAALIFMVAGAEMYLNKNPLQDAVFTTSNVVENTTLKIKSVFLPDSSKVELSPNSKIVYANDFETNRRIKVEGEAYFKVKKDKKHPFQVFCNETTTTVLGTSFTVKEFTAKGVIVALYEGSVQMNVKGNAKKWILKPGQQFTYGNENIAVAAFERFMDFDNQKLNAVCDYVEATYGYKMIIPQEYNNQRITVRINKKEELKTIVQLLSEMYNLNFEINYEVKKITFQ